LTLLIVGDVHFTDSSPTEHVCQTLLCSTSNGVHAEGPTKLGAGAEHEARRAGPGVIVRKHTSSRASLSLLIEVEKTSKFAAQRVAQV